MTDAEQLTSTAGMTADQIAAATAEGQLDEYLRTSNRQQPAAEPADDGASTSA